jgi:hypothetical protein
MTGQVWRRAELLDQMIARLAATGAAARLDGGDGILEARRRCLDCVCAAACERFLADRPVSGSVPSFCANAPFLARCMEAERQRAAGASHRGRCAEP